MMYSILVVISIFLALIGCFLLSQATLGVGVICLAVLAAIWARLAQAHSHHSREVRLFEADQPSSKAEPGRQEETPYRRDVPPPYSP